MKQISSLILLSSLFFTLIGTSAHAIICEPCSVCALSTYGGVISNSPTDKANRGEKSSFEKLKAETQELREELAEAKQKATSYLEEVSGTYADVKKGYSDTQKSLENATTSNPGNEEGNEEGKKAKEAANKKLINTPVNQIIQNNLSSYDIEKKGDYKNEAYTVQRRQYIRQQATIKLMARALVLRYNFKTIKEMLDNLDKRFGETEKGVAGNASNETTSDKTASEASLLAENAELRLIWYRLLIFQKQLEAARLEFAANQALSNMKIVKQNPKITSGGILK